MHLLGRGARAFPLHAAHSSFKPRIDCFREALPVDLRRDGVPVSVMQIMPAALDRPIFGKVRTKTGYEPLGRPPIYEPGTLAGMLLHAAGTVAGTSSRAAARVLAVQ